MRLARGRGLATRQLHCNQQHRSVATVGCGGARCLCQQSVKRCASCSGGRCIGLDLSASNNHACTCSHNCASAPFIHKTVVAKETPKVSPPRKIEARFAQRSRPCKASLITLPTHHCRRAG